MLLDEEYALCRLHVTTMSLQTVLIFNVLQMKRPGPGLWHRRLSP